MAIVVASLLLAPTATAETTPGGDSAAESGQVGSAAKLGKQRVVLISVDGLSPWAISRLGKKAEAFTRLRKQGAGTLNARTPVERTETLPNHTSIVTGLRPARGKRGHGVVWNDERPEPATVHQAAGRRVGSVFSKVRASGGSSALFTTKEKFSLLERSWSRRLRTVIDANDARLTKAAIRDLTRRKRAFTMLHLGLPDHVGHQHGGRGKKYLAAVRTADALVSRVLRKVRSTPALRKHVTVIVTADHGFGAGRRHSVATKRANYRIPFFVWGRRVDAANLYTINPGFTAPGKGRPRYDDPRPIRNGDAANLALDLLGLPALKGSAFNADQALRWRAPKNAGGAG